MSTCPFGLQRTKFKQIPIWSFKMTRYVFQFFKLQFFSLSKLCIPERFQIFSSRFKKNAAHRSLKTSPLRKIFYSSKQYPAPFQADIRSAMNEGSPWYFYLYGARGDESIPTRGENSSWIGKNVQRKRGRQKRGKNKKSRDFSFSTKLFSASKEKII